MKKYIVSSFLALSLTMGTLYAEDTTSCTNSEAIEFIGAVNTLNDASDLSFTLVQNSKDLLALSESLLAAGSNANSEYIEAMLKLSDDIGDMAERILEMADKILIMADKIGDMADRIVETQKIQSENVKLTQDNLLKAQANFNQALENLGD